MELLFGVPINREDASKGGGREGGYPAADPVSGDQHRTIEPAAEHLQPRCNFPLAEGLRHMPGKAGIFTENARPRRRNRVEHAFKAKHDVGLAGGRALSKLGKDLQSSGIQLGGGARSTLARVLDFDELAVGTSLDEGQKQTGQRIRIAGRELERGSGHADVQAGTRSLPQLRSIRLRPRSESLPN